ncbi:hypothetical protein [Blautia intestinalis]|uniref:hypothetical protein n=1 Tax=Blautia intestinalis TaxID=2763028 RepID=UPI0022DF607B|nr:hypothetical protein [Blautia intestinalis]
MKLNEKIIEVIENNGFCCGAVVEQDNGFYIELYQDTPAGEDWHVTIWFNGSDNDFINSFIRYSEIFDVDEEAEIWIKSRGKHGVPSSISVLVKDAEWKKETLGKTVKDLEDIDENEYDIMTFFVLDSVNDKTAPVVFFIPLNKQLEVENLAKTLVASEDFYEVECNFEKVLKENNIEYEWIGKICDVVNRQKDWIDDKISRVIVG